MYTGIHRERDAKKKKKKKTYAVPEPIRGCRYSDALGADRQREYLSNDHPRGRTPCCREAEDVHTHKRYQDLIGHFRVRLDGADYGHDELRHNHDECAPEQKRAPAELLDAVKRQRSGRDIDYVGNDGDDEWVLNADLLEECSAIVNCRIMLAQTAFICPSMPRCLLTDEVDSRPLLKHLKKDTDKHTAKVPSRVPQPAMKQIQPAVAGDPALVLKVRLDFCQLGPYKRVVRWMSAHTRQRSRRVFQPPSFDVVSG